MMNQKVNSSKSSQAIQSTTFEADCSCTGKSLSEALIFALTNPQYDDRFFIELQVQYMKIASSEHVENIVCT